MANLEKHVKAPAEQVAEAERSLVPTHARGIHLVDRYIKGRKVGRQLIRGTTRPADPPFLLRLDELPATPGTVARIRKRVEEINRRLRQSEMPFRLRVV